MVCLSSIDLVGKPDPLAKCSFSRCSPALELSQIYPVWDEDNEEDHPALSVTFADPYFVIIRDNHSVLILQSDKSGDLDEVEAGEVITSERYISASLYRDSNHFFVPKDETQEDTKDTVLLFLLREDGQFSVRIFHYDFTHIQRANSS